MTPTPQFPDLPNQGGSGRVSFPGLCSHGGTNMTPHDAVSGPTRDIRALKLAYLIPATPSDGFYAQVAMFRMGLDALGPPYSESQVILTIGADEGTVVPPRWRQSLNRVEVNFVQRTADASFRGQVAGRWSMVPSDVDVVVLGNADTLAIARYDELVGVVHTHQLVAGAIVHSPLRFPDGMSNEAGWRMLANRLLDRDIECDHHTTLPNSHEGSTATPYYVNGGAVFIGGELFKRLRPVYLRIEPTVAGMIADPRFSHQASLALAIRATDAPRIAMEMRYNFPNDPRADELYPDDSADIRTLHFLRTTEFDRQKIFADADGFARFLALRLGGSNAVLQRRVRELTGGRYPFE